MTTEAYFDVLLRRIRPFAAEALLACQLASTAIAREYHPVLAGKPVEHAG